MTTNTTTTASYENAATAALPSSAPRTLQQMLALEDFEPQARRILPRPIYGYIAGGTETDAALRGNRSVFDELSFVPRVLVNTAARDARVSLFGRTYHAPFGMAPMGGTSLGCFRGDQVLARVAGEANIPMIMSGAALTPLEKVRAEGRTAWFQAYLPGDDARRLRHAGADGGHSRRRQPREQRA